MSGDLNRQQFRQEQLFDAQALPVGPMTGRQLLPENWLRRKDVAVHSSEEGELPEHDSDRLTDYGSGSGFHFGSEVAALERRHGGVLHPRRIDADVVGSGDDVKHPISRMPVRDPLSGKSVWEDNYANYSNVADQHVAAGRVIPYVNRAEDHGSVSYRVPPSSLRSWEDDVEAGSSDYLKDIVSSGGRLKGEGAGMWANEIGRTPSMFYSVPTSVYTDEAQVRSKPGQHRGGEYLSIDEAFSARDRLSKTHDDIIAGQPRIHDEKYMSPPEIAGFSTHDDPADFAGPVADWRIDRPKPLNRNQF